MTRRGRLKTPRGMYREALRLWRMYQDTRLTLLDQAFVTGALWALEWARGNQPAPHTMPEQHPAGDFRGALERPE